MKIRQYLTSSIVLTLLCSFYVISCSKPDTAAVDACAGKTIIVSGSITQTSGGSSTNGSISVSATGSNNFTYSLNNGIAQSSGTFSNLSAGNYTVTAKDNNGCNGSQTFNVTASPCPTIIITATSTNATSPTATNGALMANATGSTGLSYRINNAVFQASGSFTGLAAGSYTITVQDLNGCTNSATFIVTSNSCPTIMVTTTTTNASGPTAANGSLTANATGGVAPYMYSKDGGTTFQTSGMFSNLTAGNYTIISKDANSCLGSSGSVAVANNPCPTITVIANTLGSDKCTNNNGSITINASGSTGFMYNLNGGTFQTSNVFNTLGTGNYNIVVRDNNGCTNNATAQVPVKVAGPQFTNVKSIMTANCSFSGCHGGANPQNGIDFNDDCTIVSKSARIKARAVDGNPSIMPASGSISASDKQKIIDWINGGGQHSN